MSFSRFDDTQPGTWCVVAIDAREILFRGTARQVKQHIQSEPRYHQTGSRGFIVCQDLTPTPKD